MAMHPAPEPLTFRTPARVTARRDAELASMRHAMRRGNAHAARLDAVIEIVCDALLPVLRAMPDVPPATVASLRIERGEDAGADAGADPPLVMTRPSDRESAGPVLARIGPHTPAG